MNLNAKEKKEFDRVTKLVKNMSKKKAKIRSDFPFTQTFDSRDADFTANTKTKVEAYRDAIVTRFTTAIEDLRASEDTFSGERTYNI